MRVLTSPLALSFAAATLLATLATVPPAHAAPNAAADTLLHAEPDTYAMREGRPVLIARQGHDHGHGHGHAAPLLVLNETDLLLYHEPSPPSYGTHDFEDLSVEHKYPYLMALHVFFMGTAFFGALPIGVSYPLFPHIANFRG